jgi:hypothetical protein
MGNLGDGTSLFIITLHLTSFKFFHVSFYELFILWLCMGCEYCVSLLAAIRPACLSEAWVYLIANYNFTVRHLLYPAYI